MFVITTVLAVIITFAIVFYYLEVVSKRFVPPPVLQPSGAKPIELSPEVIKSLTPQ